MSRSIDISTGVKITKVNGVKHYQLTKESTLYNMARKGVKMVYKNNWNETKVLPKRLQQDMLISWLQCDESIPESDDDLERITRAMEDGWESMKPIWPAMFLNLMRLPNGVPPFAYERNHIIWDYYVWMEQNREKKICECCMSSKGQSYKPYSANVWLENGWSFKRVQDHSILCGDEIMDCLIWDRENWCSECITEPLWIHILDDEECLDEFQYHLKRRRRWSSSSSEDSDIEYKRETNIVGNRMCPSMYNIFKKNKWLK